MICRVWDHEKKTKGDDDEEESVSVNNNGKQREMSDLKIEIWECIGIVHIIEQNNITRGTVYTGDNPSESSNKKDIGVYIYDLVCLSEIKKKERKKMITKIRGKKFGHEKRRQKNKKWNWLFDKKRKKNDDNFFHGG